MMPDSPHPWFGNAIIYQIYPRSFSDSNGDGVGDLTGIRRRLDYLNDGKGGGLGIDAIWLSPFYPSPMKDFGYDVADYRGVDPVFGTMDDFDRLLEEAHARGIRVLIDLVVNHTSDRHPWFVESKVSRDNPKSDWYIWRDARPDGSPPTNWLSMFGGSAWEWNDVRGQYFLHSFLKEQPDLNWENPAVRDAMADVMRFWLDKGVDGFRVDAVDMLGKDPAFEDETPNPGYRTDQKEFYRLVHTATRDAGNMFSYLRLMAGVAAGYPERLLLLEAAPLEEGQMDFYPRFYREIGRPFCLPFNLELVFSAWEADAVQRLIDGYQARLRPGATPVYVLSNHDNPRFATRAGGEAVRAGAVLLLTLPGISLIYYGDELGMADADVRDKAALDPEGRDACRTPMPWTNGANAGFSSGRAWLPVGEEAVRINAETQRRDEGSVYGLYRALVRLRRTHPALRTGSYRPGPRVDGAVSFIRDAAGARLWVLVNMSGRDVPLPAVRGAAVVVSTRGRVVTDGFLMPHEGLILDVSGRMV